MNDLLYSLFCKEATGKLWDFAMSKDNVLEFKTINDVLQENAVLKREKRNLNNLIENELGELKSMFEKNQSELKIIDEENKSELKSLKEKNEIQNNERKNEITELKMLIGKDSSEFKTMIEKYRKENIDRKNEVAKLKMMGEKDKTELKLLIELKSKKQIMFKNCKTTNYQNDWDKTLNYVAPSGFIITGMSSYHQNHYEDRRWKFTICKITI